MTTMLPVVQLITGIAVPILCAAKLYYSFHEELALVKRDVSDLRETQLRNVTRLESQSEEITALKLSLASLPRR